MRTALLLGKDSIQVQSTQQPEIGPGDVLLRTKASLICGTDVRILRYGHAAISSGTRRILGHELSGVIARVGSDVSSLKTGMRVAVAPNMGCGLCDQCVSGNMHLCADYRALGIHIDGGFAEYVRIPSVAVRQGNVIDIPPQMSFVEAALAEPLSCVYNGFERCALRPGDTVLVMGAGPIGLMHAKMAKLGGASTVFVSDLNSERLLRCRHIDASLVALDANDIEGKIMDFTSARGVDVCITACPSAEAQQQSLQLTAVNGRVLFFGGLPTNASEVHLDTNLIHYKQLMVTGTTRASMRQFRTVLSLVGRGTLTVKEFITETFDIAEIRQAFAYTAQGLGLRCMIAFDGHAK
ncbi:MAG: alcohol dehydrogenase catalytic domain-containing protein [Phycisphaerae bacterium]|nr:alcohol dehydrogenase catalytic domain-containing protein [Phycisphaerae bacterium]